MKINIETTNYCNAKCIMCPHKVMKRNKGFMSLDLLETILRDLPDDVNEISLSLFGEPLIDKRMPKIFKMVRNKYKRRLILFTNGSFLGDWVNGLIYEYLDYICISFNGYDKKSYEKNMKLDFDNSIGAINEFLNKKSNRLKVDVMMLNMDYSEENKKAFRSLFPMGIINPVRSWGDFQSGGNGKGIMCGRPLSLNVLWDGKVVLCCRDYEGEYIFGDLNKKTISEIWDSDYYREVRSKFINKERPYKICERCYPI